MRISTVACCCAALMALSIPAAAEPSGVEPSNLTLGLGARIGGYGFREVNGDQLSWEDCRMNGTGLFGTLDVGRHFFGEVSADLYHATAGPVAAGMDRTSFHTLAAVGARLVPDFFISPYFQAGAGPEFTRIDLDGTTDRFVVPQAFMGVGGELSWKQFHFGASLRVFSMALPEHGHAVEAGVVHQHLEPQDAIEMRRETAAQGLFSLRYTFD